MKKSLRFLVVILLITSSYQITQAAKLPKIKVKINKNLPVEMGETVTISWDVTNAKELYCYEICDTALPLSGYIEVEAVSSKDYLFIAKRGRKEKRKELNLYVSGPVFTKIKIPEVITDEETLSINWEVDHAEYVIVEGIDDMFLVQGKIPFKTDKDTTVKIYAVNKFGYATAIEQKVKVDYVETLYYPIRVPRNSAAQIIWDFKNTDSICFVDMSNALPPSGDIYIPISESSKLRMNIYRKDGTFEVENIQILAYDSKIKHFNGNKTFFKGDAITISWIVEDADSVKLSCTDEIQPLKGTYSYKPEGDELIEITAYLNGIEDQRFFKTNIITRKYVSGETNYRNINKNVRMDFEIFATDLSEFPGTIKLYVLVVDSSGNFVHGLAPPTISKNESSKYFMGLVESYYGGGSNKITDFKVKEYVSYEDVPQDISLVLDYSGSMSGEIKELEYSTKSFINNKRNQDRLSIIKFDDHIEQLTELTNDLGKINTVYRKRNLDGFGGGTALYAAIGEGLYSFINVDKPKEIIVFTDGYENSSLFVENAKAISAQQIAEIAKENDIKINCISFGENVNESLLNVLSAYTGGQYYSLHSHKDISDVWLELPYLSANYYEISFKSKSAENLNGVNLIYNNNRGEKKTTKKEIFLETPYSLNEVVVDTALYWFKYDTLYNNKTPISLPQAIGFFSFNGTIMLEDYVKNVEILVEKMNSDTSLNAVIFGHTDMVDTDEYNQKLSEKRCGWVKDYIIEQGIDESRLISIPLGEKYPIHTNEEEDWQSAENRRIEVLLLQ